MAHKKVELNDEPHEYEAGQHKFRFPADIRSRRVLQPYKALLDASGGRDLATLDPRTAEPEDFDRIMAVNDAMNNVLSELMVEDDRPTFAQADLPDWVLGDMFRWIMGVYGERPTTPSNESSQLPSNNGDASTEKLPSPAAAIPTTGDSLGSSML